MLRPQATICLLDMLHLYFFDKLSYSIWPKEFIGTEEILRLETVTVTLLKDNLQVDVCSHYNRLRLYSLWMSLGGRHLDWQVASIAPFFSHAQDGILCHEASYPQI